jgi:hypothetical protein
MEAYLNIRVMSGGWLFIAAVLGSLLEVDPHRLGTSMARLNANGGTAFAIAVLGAIAGIGAPSAFGLLLERVIAACLWLNSGLAHSKDHRHALRDSILTDIDSEAARILCELSGGAVFNVCFFTNANTEMIHYVLLRRAQFYTAAVSSLSIVIGVLVGCIWMKSIPWVTIIIATPIACLLLIHAVHLEKSLTRLETAWLRIEGSAFIGIRPRQLSR